MDRLSEMELFVRVAEAGSLTKAADALNLSTSAASRHLMSLEDRLGVRLVQRTTRTLHITEAGTEFYGRCKDVLAEVHEAEATVSERAQKPSGLLRVSAPLSFCMLHIEPMLPEFTARYPDITLDIVAANRYHDLVEHGVDVAVRTRHVEQDSNITIRRLAQTRRVLAASPAYLREFGRPDTVEALAQHRLLNYVYADARNCLTFRRGEEIKAVKVKPLLEANDGQVLLRAALNSLGILIQPKYIVFDEIASGRLVSVLDDWRLPNLTINIAFPTRRNLPAKTRCFIEALAARFEQHDYERLWTE
jgi:DNA-binding transcriptional LysR family regulator